MLYIKNIKQKIKMLFIILLCLLFCISVEYKKDQQIVSVSAFAQKEKAGNITFSDLAQRLEEIFLEKQ